MDDRLKEYHATNMRQFVKMGADQKDIGLAAAHIWMVQDPVSVYGIGPTREPVFTAHHWMVDDLRKGFELQRVRRVMLQAADEIERLLTIIINTCHCDEYAPQRCPCELAKGMP